MIQYNLPSSSGVEILVKQGTITPNNFTKFNTSPTIILPMNYFSTFASIKYFIPYSLTIETSDLATAVIVPINLSFSSALTALTQVLPTRGSALYTCSIIPFSGANQFDENNWFTGGLDLVLTASVNSPLADYGEAKYTLLYSLITAI